MEDQIISKCGVCSWVCWGGSSTLQCSWEAKLRMTGVGGTDVLNSKSFPVILLIVHSQDLAHLFHRTPRKHNAHQYSAKDAFIKHLQSQISTSE